MCKQLSPSHTVVISTLSLRPDTFRAPCLHISSRHLQLHLTFFPVIILQVLSSTNLLTDKILDKLDWEDFKKKGLSFRIDSVIFLSLWKEYKWYMIHIHFYDYYDTLLWFTFMNHKSDICQKEKYKLLDRSLHFDCRVDKL